MIKKRGGILMNYFLKNHKSKEIVYCNYNACKSDAEMIALNEAIYNAAKERKEEKKYLVLCNFAGVRSSKHFLESTRKFGIKAVEFSEKIAIIGVVGARRFLIDSFSLVTGIKHIKHFNNEKEALSWLVQ